MSKEQAKTGGANVILRTTRRKKADSNHRSEAVLEHSYRRGASDDSARGAVLVAARRPMHRSEVLLPGHTAAEGFAVIEPRLLQGAFRSPSSCGHPPLQSTLGTVFLRYLTFVRSPTR